MLPSVESIVMKLVVLVGSELPAAARSSVLMLKLRSSPHGAQTRASTATVSVACQLSSSAPVKLWLE